jgi:endonuclease/exonuclease/phosphatase family metal-dependent hydrolase
VQAELFYGVRTAVPAFAYYDRPRDTFVNMATASASQFIESMLEARDPGLLRGGSAWSDVFTGGAESPHLCAPTTGLRVFIRALTPVRLVTMVVWHGWSILRVVGNLLIETGLALFDFVRGTLGGANFLEELRFIPLRVAVTAGMREIVTAGACIDAERGIPIIHVNYLGYDEHAHRRGPHSRFARWTLRGIDRSVRRVWLAAHRSRRRDYQVWIYSDHGQQTTVPYPVRHGESVGDAVKRVYREHRDMPARSGSRHPLAHAPIGARRSEWLGAQVPPWMRPRPEASAARQSDEPIVVHEGPMGFVYLPEEMGDVDRDALAARLCRDANIPIVMAADSLGGAHVWTARGERMSIPIQAAQVFGPDHPHLEELTEDMLRVVHHDHSGAFTLLGWSRDEPMSLQFENGAHGGPGVEETTAFAVLPPEVATEEASILRPLDIRRLALGLLGRSPFPAAARNDARRLGERGPLPTAVEPVGRLRVLTYNVHQCRGMDGKYSPQRIARVVARLQPDIICLRELDQSRTRSGSVDQVEEISALLSADYAFHAVAEFDDGRFGNAILTAFPMTLVKSGPLPRMSSRLNLEERGVLWVRVSVGGESINVFNTHLSVHPRERLLQAETLVSEMWLRHPDLTGPVVLTGDFNASGRSPTAQRVRSVLRDVADGRPDEPVLQTWSGRLPVRRIDHIYVNDTFHVRGLYVPHTRLSKVASDHLPLVVDLSCCWDRPPLFGDHAVEEHLSQD